MAAPLSIYFRVHKIDEIWGIAFLFFPLIPTIPERYPSHDIPHHHGTGSIISCGFTISSHYYYNKSGVTRFHAETCHFWNVLWIQDEAKKKRRGKKNKPGKTARPVHIKAVLDLFFSEGRVSQPGRRGESR